MAKIQTKDIIDRIIYELPIENSNINDIIYFKNLIQEELNFKIANQNKIAGLQEKYLKSNNPLAILPLIYLETKNMNNLYISRLEQLNEALQTCISPRCNHEWIDDVYEDAMEREIKIKYCTKCGNCHKIKF